MLSWDDFNQEEIQNRGPESKLKQKSAETDNRQQPKVQEEEYSDKPDLFGKKGQPDQIQQAIADL